LFQKWKPIARNKLKHVTPCSGPDFTKQENWLVGVMEIFWAHIQEVPSLHPGCATCCHDCVSWYMPE